MGLFKRNISNPHDALNELLAADDRRGFLETLNNATLERLIWLLFPHSQHGQRNRDLMIRNILGRIPGTGEAS